MKTEGREDLRQLNLAVQQIDGNPNGDKTGPDIMQDLASFHDVLHVHVDKRSRIARVQRSDPQLQQLTVARVNELAAHLQRQLVAGMSVPRIEESHQGVDNRKGANQCVADVYALLVQPGTLNEGDHALQQHRLGECESHDGRARNCGDEKLSRHRLEECPEQGSFGGLVGVLRPARPEPFSQQLCRLVVAGTGQIRGYQVPSEALKWLVRFSWEGKGSDKPFQSVDPSQKNMERP